MSKGRHTSRQPSNSPVTAKFIGKETDPDKRALYDAAGGGQKRLVKTCSAFYGAAGADDRVKHYFAGSQQKTLTVKMARMVGFLLGGMRMRFFDIRGREITWDEYLVQAHARYNITDEHYDVICYHFMRALVASGYDNLVTETIGKKLVAAEPLVVRVRVLRARIEDRQTFQQALDVMTHAGSAHANAEILAQNISD